MSADATLWQWEKRFVRALATAEKYGVSVDQKLARSEIQLGSSRMTQIIESMNGLNPSSSKDLERLLLEELELPIVRTTPAGKPSFDKFAMEEYEALLVHRSDPTAQLVLEYRGWQKAISAYFENFLAMVGPDRRLHPHYKLHGTRTGRLSCENPNLQQIPKTTDEAKRWNLNTKKCIIPIQGYRLWELDYANLELRLAAIYSGQSDLVDAFNSDTVNIWQTMSDLLGGWEKSKTKTLTYAILYGAGVKKTAQTLGQELTEAKKTRKKYFDTFPKFKWAADTINNGARNQGYVRYWTGRRRHFPPTESVHKAFNSVLQGGGAEIVKRALVRIFEEVCDEWCRLVLTVHDSIVLEILDGLEDTYLELAQNIMEEVPREYFGMKFGVDAHEWGMAA